MSGASGPLLALCGFAEVLLRDPACDRGQPLVAMVCAKQLDPERDIVDAEQRQVDGRRAQDGGRFIEDRAALIHPDRGGTWRRKRDEAIGPPRQFGVHRPKALALDKRGTVGFLRDIRPLLDAFE